MNWHQILAQKTFWIYYLRLFQNFDGNRVAACCAFFGVEKAELEEAILHNLYKTHCYEEENITFHTLSIPTIAGNSLEIEFQNYGPGEQFRLIDGAASVHIADVDIDDICVPCLPLHALLQVADHFSGDLAQTYGALLLYKLTYVTPEEDIDALAGIMRAAFPQELFTPAEQEHIVASQQRAWRNRQRYPRPIHMIEHPAWQRLIQG